MSSRAAHVYLELVWCGRSTLAFSEVVTTLIYVCSCDRTICLLCVRMHVRPVVKAPSPEVCEHVQR